MPAYTPHDLLSAYTRVRGTGIGRRRGRHASPTPGSNACPHLAASLRHPTINEEKSP